MHTVPVSPEAGLWIRIDFNPNSDLAFWLNPDPESNKKNLLPVENLFKKFFSKFSKLELN
jgi:hypothetical protein